MKKVVITGGMGFMGSHFVRFILKKEPTAQVVNIDALTYAANPANLKDVEKNPRYQFIKADINDRKKMFDLMRSAEWVIHFAAESHVTRSEKDPERFYKTNVEGTRNVIEAAIAGGASRILHISTDEVYGPIIKGYFKETDKKPGDKQATSAYAKSKALADDVAQKLMPKGPVIIARPTNYFGPNQFPEKALPRFATEILSGHKIPLWGEGRQVRDWLYVLDNAKALYLILTKGQPGEIYNIGVNNEPEITNRQVAELVCEALDKDQSWIELIPDPRPDHDFRYGVDISKISKLGYQPRKNTAQIIKQTVLWYRDHPQWWQPLKKRAERIYR